MTLSDPTATPVQKAATAHRRLLVFEEGAGDPVELPNPPAKALGFGDSEKEQRS
jgi:hypothetical protein